MPAHRFTQFAVIDWSGAKGDRHKGIALAVCSTGQKAPEIIEPPDRYWSRTAICDWILARADENILIGFDFSFAPPFDPQQGYLPGDTVPENAKAFHAYVDGLCEDSDLGAASFLETHHRRHFYFGIADGRKADFMRLRRCEAQYHAQGGHKPSTIFDAIGAAQVAKASFAGMRALHRLNKTLPIWPFDHIPTNGSLIVEIYTSIAARAAGIPKGRSKIRTPDGLDTALSAFDSDLHSPLCRYDDHKTDAILTAAWLRFNAENANFWHPPALNRKIAHQEGWTFGVE